jgi:hypothetical protein
MAALLPEPDELEVLSSPLLGPISWAKTGVPAANTSAVTSTSKEVIGNLVCFIRIPYGYL